ncbi:MAG: carbohydrate ABC transporter permease [Paraglaciecola sp.]|uniref:carbohydrate ABC transporter permease n=1 Tax=Pseudomonadati TaxID=3379134 RepID=UPI00273FC9EC|nr:carbohydrate ABC transporter permease [Paraglaciecola sp.]MDP5033288.1 carbohydrate ABC transporter permease [Paraglaciecola sp.]MDP5129781.1 carbohydrate ABC transporter permease [Paraglaciecola sp.]
MSLETNVVTQRYSSAEQATNRKTYFTLILISLYCIVPFFWVLLAAFDPKASQFLRLPDEITFGHFWNLFANENGLRWIFNSVLIIGIATLLTLVFAGFGGYALSRTQAWWKRPLLYAIILVRIVPPPALIVPVYKVMLALNDMVNSAILNITDDIETQVMLSRMFSFVDGYLGLILIHTAMQLPLAIWIMKTFFDAIPKDYEEAAALDGASQMQTVRRVLIPLALPGFAAAGLFAFINAWGDFLMPLMFTSSPELQTLPLGMFRAFLRVDAIDYGFLTALAVIYTLPAVIAFSFARKFLTQTFSGGVKG